MISKKIFIIVTLVIASMQASPIEYQVNDYQGQDDTHGPAEYKYGYGVHDEHTGDIKSHEESRKDDHVEGKYELVEPDGHKRIVQYTVDGHSGFNAVVHREPTNYQIPEPKNHHQSAEIIQNNHIGSVDFEQTSNNNNQFLPIQLEHQDSGIQHSFNSPLTTYQTQHSIQQSVGQHENHVTFHSNQAQYQY